jgi:PKD repeat protein
MKNTIFGSLLFFSAGLIAQPTITQTSMPNSGDTLRYSTASAAGLNLNINQKGASQTWDYSALKASGQDIYRYQSANSTPYIFYFLNQIGLKTADSFGAGPVVLKNIYSFFTKNSTVFKQEGIGYSYQGIPLAAQNKDDDEIYQFPLKYGDSDVSTFNFRFVIPGNILTYVQAGVRTNIVDGWGSITTPYKTYPSVIRIKTLVNGTDSIITQLGRFPLPRRQVIYKWLSTDERIPVLEITGTETNGNFTASQIRYRDKFLGLSSPLKPRAGFTINKKSGFAMVDTFVLTDRSTPFVTSRNWQITPAGSATFVASTNAGSATTRLIFKQAGSYNVTLVATNNFGTDDTTAPGLINIQYGLGVNDLYTNRVQISPNPCRGYFQLNAEGKALVFDASGRQVAEVNAKPGVEIDLSHLPAGLYCLKTESGKTGTLVIQGD